MAHTKEPWRIYKHSAAHVENEIGRGVCSTGGYADNFSNGAFHDENEANARRIVACVNALAGYNPDAVADVVAALESIAQGEEEVFDEDLGCLVTVSMCEDEMQEIAREALARLRSPSDE